MTSVEIRKLNMYPEWATLQGYQSVFDYVQSIQNNQAPLFPQNLNARQRQRFQEKFGTDYIITNVRNAPINNPFGAVQPQNDLVYYPAVNQGANQPVTHRVILVVVPQNLQERVLAHFYNNRETGYGVGINGFYAQICLHYLGITRDDCILFLKKQGSYNLTRPIKKVINKPILAKTSNERWECDVIYMNRYFKEQGRWWSAPQYQPNANQLQNNGNEYPPNMRAKYIFQVVDVFSGFVWAKPLTSLNAFRVIAALTDICNKARPNPNQPVGPNNPPTYPHILQCDNGHEFVGQNNANGVPVFEDWCNAHHINLIHTSSYNPTTNGKIERANETLREKIKDGFVRHNDLQWMRYLDDYTMNMNSQKKRGTKFTPFEIYTTGYDNNVDDLVNFNQDISDHSTIESIRKEAQANTIRAAHKALQKGLPPHVFQVGDRCRIKLFVLDGEMRERYKNHMGISYNAIRYTPDVYEIAAVEHAPPPPNFEAVAPQGHVWNVVRERYVVRPVLQNNQLGPPVPANADNPNLPKMFYGNDLLKIEQPNTPSLVTSRQRARQINRFIALHNPNRVHPYLPNQPFNPPQPPPPPNQVQPLPPPPPNQVQPLPPPPPNQVQPLQPPLPNQVQPPLPPPPPNNPNQRPPRQRRNNNMIRQVQQPVAPRQPQRGQDRRQVRHPNNNPENPFAYQPHVIQDRRLQQQQQQPPPAPLVNPELEVRQQNNRPQRNRNPSQLRGQNPVPPRIRHFEPYGSQKRR